MKYEVEIDINLPREKVIELMDNEENLYKWQEGLKSFEHKSGTPGQEGAVSDLVFETKKRKIEMTETITKRNFPDEFWAVYEAKGVWNEVKNTFIVTSPNTTKWKSENEFKCKGAIAVMAFLMPSAFKKQSLKYMTDFKNFAEKQ